MHKIFHEAIILEIKKKCKDCVQAHGHMGTHKQADRHACTHTTNSGILTYYTHACTKAHVHTMQISIHKTEQNKT